MRIKDEILVKLRKDRRLQRKYKKDSRLFLSGDTNLDRLLGGGFALGTIVEFVGQGGATSLAMWLASRASTMGQWIAWLDPQKSLDPLSLESAGCFNENFLWIRTEGTNLLHQSLCCVDHLLDTDAFSLIILDLMYLKRRPQTIPNKWWMRLRQRLELLDVLVIFLLPCRLNYSRAKLRLLCSKTKKSELEVLIEKSSAGGLGASILLNLEPSID